MPFPASPEQVTPEWLTSQINRAGFRGQVKEVAWQRIGAGQVGENVRFTLESEGNMPASLVGKFPSRNTLSKNLAIQLNNYAREVFFYRNLSKTLDIQAPRCLAAEFDPHTHDFIIVMEDLAPGFQIDQMSECDSDQAALALEELAKLHGPRWGDPRLADLPLLAPIRMEGAAESAYQMILPGFLQRYASRLNEAELRAVAQFGELQEAYAQVDLPRTVIHIDYRLDNMMFGGPRPLSVFDWQSVNHGHALQDASYFMGTSVSSERRAQDERKLLQHYLNVLRSYGVDLSWEGCFRYYRHFAPAGLNMSVLVSTLVGETERGNEMFMTMARRSIQMCHDLESLKSYK